MADLEEMQREVERLRAENDLLRREGELFRSVFAEGSLGIAMIGNDLRLDDGIGTCGKDGQSVPVGVGQPTLRMDGLTVGGTSA